MFGMESDTVDLSRVGVDSKQGFRTGSVASIPDHEFLVVTNRGKEMVDSLRPSDIFYPGCMPSVDAQRLDGLFIGHLLQVPQTHSGVFRGRQQLALLAGMPGHAIALLGVADKLQVGTTRAVVEGSGGMASAVEDEDRAVASPGRNHIRLHRHGSGTIDFAVMVDLLHNLDLTLSARIATGL